MQTFTGLEYLKIDIASRFGLDKEPWQSRLNWFDNHAGMLHDIVDNAEEPYMYIKAVYAYEEILQNNPTGHNMFLDATASGLQIMAALSGCKATAKQVNLINTGSREDVYTSVTKAMNTLLQHNNQVTRSQIKSPLMTHFYNKQNQDEHLNETQQNTFYEVISNGFQGATAVLQAINARWNPNTLEHTWTLPDRHVACVKVTEMFPAIIEVDELEHVTFTYRFELNTPSDIGSSLAPNIIHSIDAYIVREMLRLAKKQGFQLATIHDSFCAHPNYMNNVRQNYINILANISKMDLLESILREISGETIILTKYSNNLYKDILESEYALS